MKPKNEPITTAETVAKKITEIPDDLTPAEMSYIRGIFDGMNAYRLMHKDKPDGKTA